MELGWGDERFLSNRTQKVLVNGEKSDPIDVLPGVPLGTVLAPLLFCAILMTSSYLVLLNPMYIC